MGAVEDAVDAAAQFIGPFVDKGRKQNEDIQHREDDLAADQLIEQALSHLQAIDTAERAADPNSPYDASLAGVVYGLLDLITSLGILPHLSPGVAFSQRPRSVLSSSLSIPLAHNEEVVSRVIKALIPILEQNGTGVQPLLTQRVLPDVLSAVAELSSSPNTSGELRSVFEHVFGTLLSTTPTSRLLPILTTYLQQDLPTWLRQRFSNELAIIPLRPHGIRHTIEFLSLSYLSKNSQVPQDAAGLQSQLPIPLEAITQATRLLVSPPSGISQDDWLTRLAPQVWALLDGNEGKELSRAAGQIIAGGILNRKTTGAPGTVGWRLFARPLLQAVDPQNITTPASEQSTASHVVVQEEDLKLALRRLFVIGSSYSHAGVIKRLLEPTLLSFWGLLNYAKSRPSLDKEWTELPRAILSRYMAVSCDPKQIDIIATNLFWDGKSSWTFAPGSQGGVEIRQRPQADVGMPDMGSILSRIGNLDDRVRLLISLLVDSNVADDVAGVVFLQTTKRWLSPSQRVTKSLTDEPDIDPLSALTDAKLSEALANKFKDKLARNPQHIIELMGQLLQNFVSEHQTEVKKSRDLKRPSRSNLGSIVNAPSGTLDNGAKTESEDLVSFALSILTTLITSPHFQKGPETDSLFVSILSSLHYLSHSAQADPPLPSLITNAAKNLLQALNPLPTDVPTIDPLAQHRDELKSALTDITSPDPPNRTWALSTLRRLIQNPETFPLINVPSTMHMLLSVSIADPESYVHTAAIPVLVDLTIRAPNPSIRILVDAFIDVDEQSLHLRKEKEMGQALDFRLRVGEILNNFILSDDFWNHHNNVSAHFNSLKMIVEATLSLASRRGQRKHTLDRRTELFEVEQKTQQEGERAWGGPIPNLLDPEGENPAEQATRDALLKIVKGWEDTGIEEDVRIRASALSTLGSIMEKRLELLSQVTVDAVLQMVVLILTVETSDVKGILRRAAVLVIMGTLKAMDEALEGGKERIVGVVGKQAEEVERVIKWVRAEDVDELVRDHAASVVEGLEIWRMKQLYKVRDQGLRLGPDLGLEGNLRGLNVQPLNEEGQDRKAKTVIEEIE